MIGNKSVLVPPNVLQNIKIIFIHDLYCYTMASMDELKSGEWWEHSHLPEPNYRCFSFMWSLACQKEQYCIQMQNNRGKNERKRRERDREGRREGTLIINATGHRPFKIFKIKKKKVLLSTRTFHFSSFLQFFFYMNIISLFEKKKSKVTQHLKWYMNLSRNTLSLKFSVRTMLVMVWQQSL